MSRVDEARRRASGRIHAADGRADSSTLRIAVDDLETLEFEAYPSESPGRAAPQVRRVEASPPVARVAPATVGANRGSAIAALVSRLAQKVVTDETIMAASREQYRRLAATLHDEQAANGNKVIMIVSAVQGEGKTLTSTNLALTLSESYRRRVLLVDADLRQPSLHGVFGLDNSAGLLEALTAAEDAPFPVRHVSPHLAVLTAGQPSSDPMAGLTSARMRGLIEEARESFEWVILDTPPVALLPDANLLASMVDAAVIVVRAGSTSYELVKRAVDAIGRIRVLGVVLNGATSRVSLYGYGAGYYDVQQR